MLAISLLSVNILGIAAGRSELRDRHAFLGLCAVQLFRGSRPPRVLVRWLRRTAAAVESNHRSGDRLPATAREPMVERMAHLRCPCSAAVAAPHAPRLCPKSIHSGLRVPGLAEIVGRPHPQPSFGRRTEGLRQTHCHFDRHLCPLVHDIRESLPGAPQACGGPCQRQAKGLKTLPLHDSAWMRWVVHSRDSPPFADSRYIPHQPPNSPRIGT